MITKVLTLFSEAELSAMRNGTIFEAPGLQGQTMMFGFDKTTGEVQATPLALSGKVEKKSPKPRTTKKKDLLAAVVTRGRKRRKFTLAFKQEIVQRIQAGEKVVTLSKQHHISRSVLDGWTRGRGMQREARGA